MEKILFIVERCIIETMALNINVIFFAECKWFGSNTRKCRKITFWNTVLGIDSRPFICTTGREVNK